MKNKKFKEFLFITGQACEKVTSIAAGTTVIAFLCGLGVNILLDGVERKERSSKK